MSTVRSFWAFTSVVLAAEVATAAQEARSVFDAATVVLERNVPPMRRMLDFDLDGDLDAVGVQVISDFRSYRIQSYRNDGHGVFTTTWADSASTLTATSGELRIEVGHRNADAWPDVCIVYGAMRQDWLGTGLAFTPQPPVTLPRPATALALADLDSDGIDDVVWGDPLQLHVSVSSGSTVSITVPGTIKGLRILRKNGPAGSDVFLVHAGNFLRVFYGTPAGLGAGPSFQHGLSMAMTDTGDVDGDGDLDAVVFGMSEYRVLRRSAPGAWTLEPALTGGPAEFLRDVDGDGDLDGACCGGGGGGGGGSYPDNVQPTDFELSLNDGSGGFAPAFAIHGLGSPQLAGVVDVDGDGDADLVAGRCVYFVRGALRPSVDTALVPPVHGPRGLSDCDGDGDVDVGFSVASVYSNDGTGAFVAAVPVVSPPPPGLAYRSPGYPGDFDGDGDIDLLVELGRPSKAQPFHGGGGGLPGQGGIVSMALLCNAGNGELLPPLPASAQGVSFALDSSDPELSLLVDADQDGDLDLITRTLAYEFNKAESRLWTNEGFGSFRAGGREKVFRALWAGDVDLDGDLDLIVAGSGYGGTSTYLYLGSNPVPGRFPTLTWDSRPGYWPHEAATGIAEADFDRNGFPDFVSTGLVPFASANVLAFNNAFAAGGSLVVNSGLDSIYGLADDARVALGDLNGSLTVDALIGPLEQELAEIAEVHLKRNVGAVSGNGFDMIRQLVPTNLLVDLDGDGDLDALGDGIVFNRASP